MKKNRIIFNIILALLWGGIGVFKIVNDDMKTGLIFCAVAVLFVIPLFLQKKGENK